MLLRQMNIHINNNQSKLASFMIERFYVPMNIQEIKLHIQASSKFIHLVLLYDSAYNLRLEVKDIQAHREISIHELDYLTSPHAKSGKIHEGEWIMAFEFNKEQLLSNANCLVQVQGYSDEE